MWSEGTLGVKAGLGFGFVKKGEKQQAEDETSMTHPYPGTGAQMIEHCQKVGLFGCQRQRLQQLPGNPTGPRTLRGAASLASVVLQSPRVGPGHTLVPVKRAWGSHTSHWK